MREESHLDDMRAAIRGDFERLAERRGGQELMQEAKPPTEEPTEAPVEGPAEAEEVVELDEIDPEPPPKGFLARLFGRSL